MPEKAFKKGFIQKLSFLLKKENNVLGIDLGASSLKIVQLRKEEKGAILETYGEISTSFPGAEEAGRAVLLKEEQIIEMINHLKVEAELTAKSGFISIPLRYSFVKVIELPKMSDRELKKAIPFEARKYIPLPITEINLEWWPIFSETSQDDKISILIAASQKDVVERYKNAVSKAGINVLGAEVEVFSEARALARKLKTPVLVVDVGALFTNVTIIDYGYIRASFGLDKGSQNLSLLLSESLGIDFERAEEMKKEAGIINKPENTEIRAIMLPFIEHLLDEIERLRSTYLRDTKRSIDNIMFMGGGADLPGLIEYATQKFGVETAVGNPFKELTYPTFMQPAIKKISPSFGIAVGLALKAVETIGK